MLSDLHGFLMLPSAFSRMVHASAAASAAASATSAAKTSSSCMFLSRRYEQHLCPHAFPCSHHNGAGCSTHRHTEGCTILAEDQRAKL